MSDNHANHHNTPNWYKEDFIEDPSNEPFEIGEVVQGGDMPYDGRTRYSEVYEAALRLKPGQCFPVTWKSRGTPDSCYYTIKANLEKRRPGQFVVHLRRLAVWVERTSR